MEQKLIALDLDGTTLNEHSQISTRTRQVLQKASKAGHIVSIVTGRPYRISKDIYDKLGIKTPMVNFNGALGHIPHQNWNREYQDTFPREIALDLLNNKEKLGIKMIAAEAKDMLLANSSDSSYNDDFFPSVLAKNEILNEINLKYDPASITMLVERRAREKIIATLQQIYGEAIEVGVWGGPNPVLELEPKGITKEKGLRYLAKNFNISRKNVIAFGDEHNDIEMIDYAGWGVVMKNGIDPLKKIANDVTSLDNTQDGLANYLEDYLQLAE
ncbi:Cof-type HAD-IIB family hydrolase [Liquorilactobacillus oeni]|uniref:HAD superfamily hydrolase n=1 Tax=Liquorilactobacillus oeni DSM 19972 TaxID=1423777 RepID=A0A0R1M7Z1_9LACO|nr:Cof-type HAD-IIB family hydrolase [Liquorilactobacillus oeni]KRL04214.1 HAD superfamily hydrolase [Liquorilactobacillus oeni DSM 19972]